MIPKVIHYCWFGRGPLPQLAVKCIESWRRYCPDYEIKEWNEDNFDLSMYPYVKEAYEARKFAFVTDVVRLYALYHEGGIYMDTDVEVIKPLDPFLVHHAFSGFESETNIPTGIMASEKGGIWAKENLAYYVDKHFIRQDGSFDLTTNVSIITNYMLQLGFEQNNKFQDFPNVVTFYPKDYFCPLSPVDGHSDFTDNTHTIHHFAGSWLPKSIQYRRKLRNLLPLSVVRMFKKMLH